MPTRRITKQPTHLSEAESAICLRVKEARQTLGLDQSEVARRLGLKAHSISMIEKRRAPLRFDIALRLCRELLVNEEWLATGNYRFLEIEAKQRGMTDRGAVTDLHPIFFRLAADLWSEDVTRTIPTRTLFSDAFERFLLPVYRALVPQIFYAPRLKPNAHDGLDIFKTLLLATIDSGLRLVANEARRLGEDALTRQRKYIKVLFEDARSLATERPSGAPAASRDPVAEVKAKLLKRGLRSGLDTGTSPAKR